jgi:hypothetical protein
MRVRQLLSLATVATCGCMPRLYSSEAVYTDGQGARDGASWVAPSNRWPLSAPSPDAEGEGFSRGETILDVRAQDQFGDEVSLWQFSGQVMLLDVSTIWCRPCQILAQDAEHTWQDYRDEGFVYVTLIHEDSTGQTPDVDDLNLWTTEVPEVPITAPVLADPRGSLGTAEMVQNGQYPALVIVDRDLRVVERVDQATDEVVRAAIERAL